LKRTRSLTVDMVSQTLSVRYADNELSTFPLYTPEAFKANSHSWVKTGWAAKYSYNFSWMGRTVIHLPEDLLMVQELIHKVQPHVVIVCAGR
jgi:cephalosporin hydroxylase